MLCSESHVAYEWLNRCCFHGCCGWNYGSNCAWRLLLCSWKPTMRQGESLWKYREDTISQGLVGGMALWHHVASPCVSGLQAFIQGLKSFHRYAESRDHWNLLCKACCHFIKPASLIHSTFGAESGWGAACGVFLGLYSLSVGGRWSTTIARVFRGPSTVVATSIAASRGRLVAGEQRGAEDQHAPRLVELKRQPMDWAVFP